jgi:hypothetical protein
MLDPRCLKPAAFPGAFPGSPCGTLLAMKVAALAFALWALYLAGPGRWLVIAGAALAAVIWHLAGRFASHVFGDE